MIGIKLGATPWRAWWPACARLIGLGVLIFGLTGCGTLRRLTYHPQHTYRSMAADNLGFTRNPPKSFAVYPFRNTSWYEEAAQRGRQAIHTKFALLGTCAPLSEVDLRAREPFHPQDALRVGRELDTDAVIFGEVLTQDHIFLLLYAYAYVEMKITIYDTRTGKLIWRGSSWSFKGDFAGLSPYFLYIPLGPIIEHVYWSRMTSDLYSRIAMDMIHEINPKAITPQ